MPTRINGLVLIQKVNLSDEQIIWSDDPSSVI